MCQEKSLLKDYIKLKDSKDLIGILGDHKDNGEENILIIERKFLGKAFLSSDGVCLASVMQYENKTHKFYKIKGKEEILKAFIEKQIFYKGTRTKQILEVLSAKFYVRR